MKMATPAEFAGAPTSPPPSGFTGFLPGFFFVCTGLLSLSWCRFNGSVLMSSINANSMSLITATVFDWKKKTKNKRSTAIINQVESFQVVPQKRFAGFSFCLTFWWQVGQQTTFLVFIFLVKYKKKRRKKKNRPLRLVPFCRLFSRTFYHHHFPFCSLFSLSLSLSLRILPRLSTHTLSSSFLLVSVFIIIACSYSVFDFQRDGRAMTFLLRFTGFFFGFSFCCAVETINCAVGFFSLFGVRLLFGLVRTR